MASSNEEDEVPVIQHSREQRWPLEGEPVCIVCSRYGEYVLDETDEDVCSIECKTVRLEILKKSQSPLAEKKEIIKSTDDGMSPEQLEAFYKMMQLEVRGSNVPGPITDWSQLPLDPQLRSNLHSSGFNTVTPVQTLIVPAILKKRDLLVCSATGSGKTLSFLLPLVQLMSLLPADPVVLVLSPTRELCQQIEEQAKLLMKGIPGMRTALLIGGVPIANQLHRLKSNVKLLIATPARLLDILTNHGKSLCLSSSLQVLVVDEVDSLYQMGFEEQLQSISKHLPSKKQSLFFSATIPPKIETLATETLHNPLFITVGTPNTSSVNVRHIVLWVEEEAKKKHLFTFLKDKDTFCPPVIIFVNSRKGTLLLAEAIDKACDVAAIALHGEMEQERRSAILSGFLAGKYEAVVATGVLARGLDLHNVKQIFIFDAPSTIDEFIHQVGRSSRLGSKGWAITFINNTDKSIFTGLVDLLEPLGVDLPAQLLHHRQNEVEKRRRKRMLQDKTPKVNYHKKESLLSLIQSSSKRKH
uniref:RNA helicase n=1 Tax=Amphimedon queenslandica TaxID=400682 RepID=A0A1X7TXZ4_AMPQE